MKEPTDTISHCSDGDTTRWTAKRPRMVQARPARAALIGLLAVCAAMIIAGCQSSASSHQSAAAHLAARTDGQGGGDPLFPTNSATTGGATSALTWAESFEPGGAASGQAAMYSTWCLAFVANAYGSEYAGYDSAWDLAQSLTLNGPSDPAAAPVGSLMFFGPNSYNEEDGHVGLSLGGGQMISANVPSASIPGVVLNYPNPDVQSSSYWSQLYRGWAWPPKSWGPLAQQAAAGYDAPPASTSPSTASTGTTLTVTTHPSSAGGGLTLQNGDNPQQAGSGGAIQAGANPQQAGNGEGIQNAPQHPVGGSGGGAPVTTPKPASTPTPTPTPTPPPTKALTVDASAYFGNCTSPNVPSYCGADAHSQSSPNFNKNAEGSDWPGGTQTTGLCWTTGGNVNAPATNTNSDVWIETTLSSAYPWMSALYFQPGAASGLDHC